MKKRRFPLADLMMKARDFTEEQATQKTLIVGASLQMFLAGLLAGLGSGIGEWDVWRLFSALAVVSMWAFNLNPMIRIFRNAQKNKYEQGFDDALEFAKGDES